MQKPSRYKIDRLFLFLIVGNVIFGAIMLASASAPVSLSRYHNTWFYIWHQLYAGIVPGLILMWVLSRIDYHVFKKYSFFIFAGAMFLMVLVFIPGLAAHYATAKSWIVIGGVSFEPAEILKIAFVLYASALLAGDEKNKPGAAFFPALFALAAAALMLALQPDLGELLLLCASFIALVVAAGSSLTYVFSIVIVGFAALYSFAKAAPYRAARLTVFLHPELDPQGIGYQINQALLAIGSGGVFGVGLGHSRQKFSYLPEVINDSIFPIIGEELGLIFTFAYVALVVAIFLRGMKIARAASDNYGRLVTIGFVAWFFTQSLLNIGAMIGILPLTGVPLPFVSYGGTSMIASLAAVGIILSVSRGTANG